MNLRALSIPESLSRARLEALLAGLGGLRAAVVGDFALDAYWQVDMTRSHLSRETPHFPRPVVGEVYSPGAGGNAAANLAALGVGRVSVFSVLGEDLWGGLLRERLQRLGVDTRGLLTHPQRRTIAYIKPILRGYNSQQEDARLDFENTQPLPEEMEDRLVDALAQQISHFDLVLVLDQFELLGAVTPAVRERLIRLAADHPNLVFMVDSRVRIGQFRGMTLKPNWLEAAAAVGMQADAPSISLAAQASVGGQMSAFCGRPVFLTLSELGVLVCQPDQQVHIVPAPVSPPLDVVGAGDAFMTAAACALAAGASPREAGALANLAAAVTTEKLNQTGAASPEEILARYEMACG